MTVDCSNSWTIRPTWRWRLCRSTISSYILNIFVYTIFFYLFMIILLGRTLQPPRGKGHKRTSRSYSKVPHLTNPLPLHWRTKNSQSTGITRLFSNSAWVLLRPKELSTFKESLLWDGTCGLSSFSEKTRTSNHLLMKLQRQHVLLSYLKTLSVGPVGVSNSRPPASQPGEQSSELPVRGWNTWNSCVWTADRIAFVCMILEIINAT